MQTEYANWALRCLLVTAREPATVDIQATIQNEEYCSRLDMPVLKGGMRRGHLVRNFLLWLADEKNRSVPAVEYDFVLM